MTRKENVEPGEPFSDKRILLALLPYWTPLIPPQGIARIKAFLQPHGYRVRTIDANLDEKITRLYDRYCDTLMNLIPGSNRGNFYNIRNDVWREHMMAHLHYRDEKKYIQLVKILIYKIFYCHAADHPVFKLKNILDEFYCYLEAYFLQKLEKDYPEYDSFFLMENYESDFGGGHTHSFDVYGRRKETDKERDKRLIKAKKQRESQKKRREKEAAEKEIRERKQYEKLKTKFEKGK